MYVQSARTPPPPRANAGQRSMHRPGATSPPAGHLRVSYPIAHESEAAREPLSRFFGNRDDSPRQTVTCI